MPTIIESIHAKFYQNGWEIEKDLKKAFYWYQKSIINAKCYQNGWGIKIDLENAFHWYQESSIQNNSNSLYNLAKCYQNGLGIKIDNIKSFEIYEKLAKQGYCDAQNKLGFFYENGEITKEFFLVMEYAKCGNLQNYLKRNFDNLTWNDKTRLSFQIADGLNYLHNEDILHRDLHSKNIVIHENNAKITDFGISKIENNSTMHIGLFSRIAYMEPQMLISQNFKYIKPSDIYSYGVLMWEISSGHPPFIDYNDNLLIAIINQTREKTIPKTPEKC
ncbi:619_t:CDS:2 [Funneliformis geosporum]|uniref:619_t:CDS:1 n=1 Tax=Funneliformis geosporum TaxID=1117311 RepID=A0A9W4WN52_9GLOM|nr:619_t:CDS:2 [Funneliformis geosporum]